MKSLSRVAPLSFLALSLTLVSCATPANRRELYFSTRPHGPWTDYERRREAEARTGVSSAATPTTTTTTNLPPTKQPKSEPVVAPPPPAVTPVDPVPAPVAPAPDASAIPATPPAQ